MSARVFTIGHSTLPLEGFVALLRERDVRRLADIRRYPGSRRYPHFGRDALAAGLEASGIAYEHFEDLGGRRHAGDDSPNGAWRNPQFRAYADHMATAEFAAAVDRLVASPLATAVMCAEAVPWRCHRNLLSDELVRRGIEVLHILGPGSVRPHVPTKDAVFLADHVVYPPEQAGLFGQESGKRSG